MNNDMTQTPADVREQIRAAIREGVRYVAKADGAYLYEPSVDETADRILSLLRGAAGEDVRERVAREVFAWEHGRRGAAAEWISAQWQGETPKRRAMYFDLADRILAILRTPRGEGERVQGAWATVEAAALAQANVLDSHYGGQPSRAAEIRNAVEQVAAFLRTPRGEGEGRWEDLVFGPIVEAYNEAHAARRSDAQEKGDALVCASCGEPIGDEPTVIWQDAYTHYRCTPEDAIRDDTPVIRPIDAARRGEGGRD